MNYWPVVIEVVAVATQFALELAVAIFAVYGFVCWASRRGW